MENMTQAVQTQPAIIRGLIDRATKQTLSDGTESYFLVSRVTSREREAIKKAKTGMHPHATVYVGSGETFSWSARFGDKRSTEFVLYFSFDDYTVPLKNEKGEGEGE